jgi:hypothetical protein
MRNLTPAGQQWIEEVAQRHGFSTDAVMSMLESVIRGNGSMAQFNHPEFGGSGQWMQGGMTMVSDMFNNYLKGRVDGLCSELSRAISNQPDLIRSGSFQSQSQGNQQWVNDDGGQQQQQGAGYGNSNQQQTAAGPVEPVSLFVAPAPGTWGDWWPADLGRPNSTGAQNDIRYAYFAQPRRLAIEVNGKVTVYDTLDHQISGFSQQQSRGASLTFASQHGLVAVAGLPVVPVGGVPQPASPPAPPPASAPASPPVQTQREPVSTQSAAPEADVFTTIEKLAQLHAKGILSDEEFATKKAELLSRL